MQVLVLYHSKTGNTEKLAQAVVEGVKEIKDVNALLKSVSEVTEDDFVKSTGIIAGSPVYFGTMSHELKTIFDKFVPIRKKMEGKIGAAFATAGHHTGGKETTIMSILQAMLIYGMIIVGDPMSASGHYGVACLGQPDKSALSDAKKLGKRVAELVKKLYGI
jgi:NAD(P)H dehydrogenase (quinone)